MGIVIFPFILLAAIISIISMVSVIKSIPKRELKLEQVFLGFVLSAAIYFTIISCYVAIGSAWVLSTGFIIPIFMVFLPYFASKTLKTGNSKQIYWSKVLLVSISITAILATIYFEYAFNFFDYYGIEKTH
ncbi:hypothetical protein [Flavobacterium microcysteis]|uniref:Uncharacterized protein n=1 Tax=Flavobacterium microcysteis TaxID=2596891 RepID=A0A501QC59_9FLAO|nr:hypothetical protein [Flavobacterium microcysteis]TPD69757.1 hypothetical protein FJA49_07565 [Flavobacterium microcysteis]